jgi:5'-3' exonuclease
MATPPPLTAEQRRLALEKAARARRRRAEVKEQLKSGALTLPDLFALAEVDELVGGLKVLGMLESLPGVGKVRARRLLAELGISESRRLDRKSGG